MQQKRRSRTSKARTTSEDNFILAYREPFCKGAFFSAVILFLIGGASLDADPFVGVLVCAVSFVLAAVIYLYIGREWE